LRLGGKWGRGEGVFWGDPLGEKFFPLPANTQFSPLGRGRKSLWFPICFNNFSHWDLDFSWPGTTPSLFSSHQLFPNRGGFSLGHRVPWAQVKPPTPQKKHSCLFFCQQSYSFSAPKAGVYWKFPNFRPPGAPFPFFRENPP